MADGITDFLTDNSNTATSAGTTLASITLETLAKEAGEEAIGKTLGIIVEPAVWAIQGKAPDAGDGFLWGAGTIATLVGSTIGGVAVATTSILKGVADDDISRKAEAASACEPEKVRKGIDAVTAYSSWSAHAITAQTIASKGGTTWQHPNGQWVFIRDAKGKLVCDYKPAVAQVIYQPLLPLRPVGDGYRWHTLRG